jgi:DUF971 family protein
MRTPDRIDIDMAARTLLLHWPDGTRQRIAHHALRLACPCVQCRRRRLRDDTVTSDEAVAVTMLNPAGYGVQVAFTDGHDRGIYPWQYLERIR